MLVLEGPYHMKGQVLKSKANHKEKEKKKGLEK